MRIICIYICMYKINSLLILFNARLKKKNKSKKITKNWTELSQKSTNLTGIFIALKMVISFHLYYYWLQNFLTFLWLLFICINYYYQFFVFYFDINQQQEQKKGNKKRKDFFSFSLSSSVHLLDDNRRSRRFVDVIWEQKKI